MAKKTQTTVQPKVRLRIRAYDHRILDKSVKQIIEVAQKQGGELVGPIPLPTEIRKFTLNRSPFVDKNSREQFEIRVHKRVIDILNPSQKIIEALNNINLPAGVDIEIKM